MYKKQKNRKQSIKGEREYALSLIRNPEVYQFEIHNHENAMFLSGIGLRVEKISSGAWWVTARDI